MHYCAFTHSWDWVQIHLCKCNHQDIFLPQKHFHTSRSCLREKNVKTLKQKNGTQQLTIDIHPPVGVVVHEIVPVFVTENFQNINKIYL